MMAGEAGNGGPILEAWDISLKARDREILAGVNLALSPGELVGLIGPNGAGKTSLMRALLRIHPKAKGSCNLWALGENERARLAGYLAQTRALAWELDVRETIELGRLPWRNLKPGTGTARRALRDDEAVDFALERLGLGPFAKRRFHSLSGGEQARVLIARLLAQDTPIILADEPISALDPAGQIGAMELFLSLAKEGRAVMLAIHDLSLAARYCDRLVLLNQGRLVADGPPDEVLSDDFLAEVFTIKAHRFETEAGSIIAPMRVLDGQDIG